MEDFFFDPIRSIVSEFDQSERIWESVTSKRQTELGNVKMNLCGDVFNTSINIREYLVQFVDQNKMVDIRNLYMQRLRSTSIKLLQADFFFELVFANKNKLKEFMEIARRYIIRVDMDRVYKFNLENTHDRVGAGGFGDVRMIQNRKTKMTYALKSVPKKKVKNKTSSANSMR